MRNLKKFLALVLAMMMVFGLMVTANAASYADFSDADKISDDYRQAAEVIAALGVMQGYGGGSFGPTGELRRSDMAAVLYRIGTGYTPDKQGKDPVLAAMKDNKVFDDVDPANEELAWAVGYINYAHNQGWITGYDGNSFGPNDTMSVMHMLTVVVRLLGIDLPATGNWELNVLQAIRPYPELTAGFEASQLNSKTPATREMVAQLSLNALTHTEEGDFAGWQVQVKATKKAVGSVFTSYADAKAFKDELVADGEYTAPQLTIAEVTDNSGSLGAKYFDLSWDTVTDEYGRTATVYSVDGEVISSVAAETALESDNGFTYKELYTALGSKATIKVEDVICAGTYTDCEAGDEIKTAGKANDNTDAIGGKGIRVEIYATSETNVYSAAVIVPTFAQVTDIREVKATKTVGAHTAYTISNGIGTLKEFAKETEDDVTDIVLNDTVKKGDYVLVNLIPKADDEDIDRCEVSLAEIVEKVAVTSYSTSTKLFTVGGETYYKSDIVNSATEKNLTDLITKDNKKYDFALDAQGNLIAQVDEYKEESSSGIDKPTSKTNFIFVLAKKEISDDASLKDSIVGNKLYAKPYYAIGIDHTGKLQTLLVASVGGSQTTTAAPESGNPGTVTLGKVYTYVQGKAGTSNTDTNTYDLTEVVNNTPAGVKIIMDADASDVHINGTTELASGWYTTDETVYYVATQDDEGEYDTPVKYTGYANIGNIDGKLGSTNVAALDFKGDGIADMVFIGYYVGAGANTKYAYVLDDGEHAGGKVTYTAIIDGEEKTLTLDDALTNDLPAMMSVNNDLTKAETLTGSSTVFTANDKKLSNKGGFLMMGTTNKGPFATGAKAWIIEDGAMTEVALSRLADLDAAACVVIVMKGNEITTVYVDMDAEPYVGSGFGEGSGEVHVEEVSKPANVSGADTVLNVDLVTGDADLTVSDNAKIAAKTVEDGAITVGANGTLEIGDANAESDEPVVSGGTITLSSASSKLKINGAVENATIIVTNSSGEANAVTIKSVGKSATVNVSNGTVKIDDVDAGATVTMTGGNVTVMNDIESTNTAQTNVNVTSGALNVGGKIDTGVKVTVGTTAEVSAPALYAANNADARAVTPAALTVGTVANGATIKVNGAARLTINTGIESGANITVDDVAGITYNGEMGSQKESIHVSALSQNFVGDATGGDIVPADIPRGVLFDIVATDEGNVSMGEASSAGNRHEYIAIIDGTSTTLNGVVVSLTKGTTVVHEKEGDGFATGTTLVVMFCPDNLVDGAKNKQYVSGEHDADCTKCGDGTNVTDGNLLTGNANKLGTGVWTVTVTGTVATRAAETTTSIPFTASFTIK